MSAINRYYFKLKAGQNMINSPKLTNVKVRGVRREGIELRDAIDEDILPVGNQFRKNYSSSIMLFDSSLPGAEGDEDVWVLTDGEGVPEPPPEEPEPEIIGGNVSNNTYPLSGNKINSITYDSADIIIGSYPGFGARDFPLEETPGISVALYKVMNTGINKTMVITITTTSLRQLIVNDSAGSSHIVNNVSTGPYTINNVTIDGINECLIALN